MVSNKIQTNLNYIKKWYLNYNEKPSVSSLKMSQFLYHLLEHCQQIFHSSPLHSTPMHAFNPSFFPITHINLKVIATDILPLPLNPCPLNPLPLDSYSTPSLLLFLRPNLSPTTLQPMLRHLPPMPMQKQPPQQSRQPLTSTLPQDTPLQYS